MSFWAKCRMDGVDGWVSGWILRLLWLIRFEILPCFGQSRSCQSKLEDSTAQPGGKEMWIISLFCYKILQSYNLTILQTSSWSHNLMGKEKCGIFWWLMVCFSFFPWVCKMDVVYISGNAKKCWKRCTGGKNAVCKLEIHTGWLC